MNSFYKGVVAGSALLLLLALAIVPAEALQRKTSTRAKRVEGLFNGNCARCHGGDGRGQTALGKVYKVPDFTDPEWWTSNPRLTSMVAMKATVTRGRPGMPAFGKKLTKAEVNLLINHVRAFRKLKPS